MSAEGDTVRVLVALDVPAHFADDPTMTECIVARLADEAGYLQDGAVPIPPTGVVAVCIEDDTPLDGLTFRYLGEPVGARLRALAADLESDPAGTDTSAVVANDLLAIADHLDPEAPE